MTELDEALQKSLLDASAQDQYYQQVLQTEFCVPLVEDRATQSDGEEAVIPLILESDGKSYLMLFDTEERLAAWAKGSVNYMRITGSGLVKLSTQDLHWAINLGGQYAKEFVPAEIEHLKTL